MALSLESSFNVPVLSSRTLCFICKCFINAFCKYWKTKVTALRYVNRELPSCSFIWKHVFHTFSESSLENTVKGEIFVYSKILLHSKDARRVWKTISNTLHFDMSKQEARPRGFVTFLSQSNFWFTKWMVAR